VSSLVEQRKGGAGGQVAGRERLMATRHDMIRTWILLALLLRSIGVIGGKTRHSQEESTVTGPGVFESLLLLLYVSFLEEEIEDDTAGRTLILDS